MSVEENRAVVLRAFEEINRGDLDAASECLAPDLALNGEQIGREAAKRRDGAMRAAFPDLHYEIEDLVAEDHKKDLEVQHKHGAKALKYWFNEEKGEVYCLFEAPNAEAAEAVHREAHGNVADEIMEVKEGS